MKNGLLKAALAFLLAVAVSFSMFPSQAWATSKYSRSCDDSILINSEILESTCEKEDGSTKRSWFYLTPQIKNDDGKLIWQPANFIDTCRDIQLSGNNNKKIVAECQANDGSWVTSRINLNEHIVNADGQLAYECD